MRHITIHYTLTYRHNIILGIIQVGKIIQNMSIISLICYNNTVKSMMSNFQYDQFLQYTIHQLLLTRTKIIFLFHKLVRYLPMVISSLTIISLMVNNWTYKKQNFWQALHDGYLPCTTIIVLTENNITSKCYKKTEYQYNPLKRKFTAKKISKFSGLTAHYKSNY